MCVEIWCFWPLTASTTSEVKNDHVHVITQDICNKFIEIKFSVGCMVSQPNRLLQRSTTMSLINKILEYCLLLKYTLYGMFNYFWTFSSCCTLIKDNCLFRTLEYQTIESPDDFLLHSIWLNLISTHIWLLLFAITQ